MARFEDAIDAVLKDEGVLETNPNDPGGITKYGISLRFYQDIKPDATADDIRALTRDMAIEIYRKCFWDKEKYNLIADQKIASKVFDLCVNIGPGMANKLLQEAVNQANLNASKIVEDGILGTESLRAINFSMYSAVYSALKENACDYYRELVDRDPQLADFLNGWLARANEDI